MTSKFDGLFANAGRTAGRHALIGNNQKDQENFDIAKDFFQGNVESLVNRALTSLISKYIPPQDRSLTCGIPLSEIRAQYLQMGVTELSRANFWHLSFEDLTPDNDSFKNINFFANSVSYQPITITSEATPIGSGSYDTVSNAERVEMNVATKDDREGSIKKYLKARKAKLARKNGTFGYPYEYLTRVSILHAYVSDGADGAKSQNGLIMADVDTYIMRVGTLAYNKDRRTDDLEELNFTMVEFDTFTDIV